MSGSEGGEILFWDVRSKEIAQRVSGHEGVVCWVDTSPGPNGTVVSGGLDGTVRIWVDLDVDDDGVGGMNELKIENENEDDDVDMVKVEHDDDVYDNTGMNGSRGERSSERNVNPRLSSERSPDQMEED